MDENDDFEPVDDNRPYFYLNTLNPANASGIVSSLWICYNLDSDDDFDAPVFQATIGFYRPAADGGSFSLMSYITLTRTSRDTLWCENVTIPNIEVEEGDVIGVCAINFNSSFRRIDFVVSVSNDDCSLILGRGADKCFLMEPEGLIMLSVPLLAVCQHLSQTIIFDW